MADKVASLNPKLIRYLAVAPLPVSGLENRWPLMNVKSLKRMEQYPKSPILLDDLKFACDQTWLQILYYSFEYGQLELSYQMEMLPLCQIR
ncbi:MAG: hypothetical protein IPK08_08005 [Bacteroidetes bacterium]|nr:hypothetical protein [Bacteroidota bacterium]